MLHEITWRKVKIFEVPSLAHWLMHEQLISFEIVGIPKWMFVFLHDDDGMKKWKEQPWMQAESFTFFNFLMSMYIVYITIHLLPIVYIYI